MASRPVRILAAAAARSALGRSTADGGGRRRGLTRTSWIAIVAVGLVVAALSITRMQVYAVHANERDAVQLLEQVGRQLGEGESEAGWTLEAVTEGLLHPVEGSTWSEDGRRLRRHGYLFELVEAADGLRVRAWPCEHALTGRAAFQWSRADGVLGHRNRRGRWSGPGAPPDALVGAEWVPLGATLP